MPNRVINSLRQTLRVAIAWIGASIVLSSAVAPAAEHRVPESPLWLTYAGENGPGKEFDGDANNQRNRIAANLAMRNLGPIARKLARSTEKTMRSSTCSATR
jgi:hypothetical protein